MRTTWIMPLAAFAAAAALLAAPTLTAQDPDPPADPVAAVTLAAEELAAAEAEARGLARTIDRRQGEADALDPRPADCADRTARRLCRRHDWYADVLADLGARKASAEARVATARAAAEALAAPTLGARVEALESEVDGLADELHAVEDELGLEIARVEAALASADDDTHRTADELLADWAADFRTPAGVLVRGCQSLAPSLPAMAANPEGATAHERCNGLIDEWRAAGYGDAATS